MNRPWEPQRVPLRFRLGDKTLLSRPLRLMAREEHFTVVESSRSVQDPPQESLEAGYDGFLIRSLPIQGVQPTLLSVDGYLRYVPSQYERYYIDLRQSFETYKEKFSSKTRSTINRKIKKFAEFCGGRIEWRSYRGPKEIGEFHALARTVSRKSYQERLLDAGLPDSEEFLKEMTDLASAGNVRAYILFHGAKPVAYLYCPIVCGVLRYQYVGYDPEYMNWSVGTILQWHALEEIFAEGCFHTFDFTEGQSDHKRQFATSSARCADVYFLRNTLKNRLVVHCHHSTDKFSESFGRFLERLGLKARVRRLIRSRG